MDKVSLRGEIDTAISAHRTFLQRMNSAAIASQQGHGVTTVTAGPRLAIAAGGPEGSSVDVYLPRVQRLNNAVIKEAGRLSDQIAAPVEPDEARVVDMANLQARSGELLRLLMQWQRSLGGGQT